MEATKIYELHPSSSTNIEFKKLTHNLRHWVNTYNTRGINISDILADLGIPLVIASIIGIKII